MSDSPEIRLAHPGEQAQILSFIESMGFNPRDQVTWEALNMSAMTAWRESELIGAIPFEPRPLRIAAGRTVRCAHETVVAVHPEHRARGIGSAMQAALFDALRGQAELVSVFREEPQSPAYRWYIANGFRPAMHVDSWFYERDSSGGGNTSTFEIFDPADPGVPWNLIEQIWQITGRSGGGFVDRAQRPLATWLAVHPYRRRYKFTLLLDRAAPGYALCGVGSMHSSSPRLDILELCSTGDANATALLLDGVLKCARNMNCASTRWPLAAQDPHVHLAQNAGFASKWGFDMLVHPLAGEFDFSPELAADWRYAGVDYI